MAGLRACVDEEVDANAHTKLGRSRRVFMIAVQEKPRRPVSIVWTLRCKRPTSISWLAAAAAAP